MRGIFVVSLGFVSAFAMASYEVVLMADNVNNVIHRYDSENHVYLGSFGRGELGTITGMALDQAGGRLFVNHQGLVSAFNYNTGDQIFSAASTGVGPIAYRAGTNDLITLTAGTLRRQQVFSNGTSSATVWATPSAGTQTLTTDGTNIYVVNSVASTMTKYTGGATGAVAATSTTNSGVTGDTFAGMTTSADGSYIFALSATDRRNYVWGGATGASSFSGAQSSLVTTTAVTRAHGIHGYYLGTTPTGYGIQKYYETGIAFGVFVPVNLSVAIDDISFAATVVAPEPGSLGVLALGACFLWRRRRN